MKYLVLIPDGMADVSIQELGNLTPMQKANKPCMDALAKESLVGIVSNVPEGMVPESDTANMAILSFDPKVYSRGRSPLEAVSMGIDMQPDETAFRCNLVTLSAFVSQEKHFADISLKTNLEFFHVIQRKYLEEGECNDRIFICDRQSQQFELCVG
jgi:2,3-diphosphopglycerate-independent phosphoglycerate mutase